MKKIIIAFVLLVIIGLTFLFYPKNIILNKKIIEKENSADEDSSPSDNQQNNPAGKNSISGSSIAGSGGGSSGGAGVASGGTQTNSQNSNCEEIQISYSLRNFVKEQTCNRYEENICVDKTSYCAIEVKNLDSETTGTFTIRFTHFEIQNRNNIIETQDVSFVLSPD